MNFFWSGVEIAITRILSFSVLVLFARQLGPEAIGKYAPFGALYLVLVVVVDGGITEILLKTKTISRSLIEYAQANVLRRTLLLVIGLSFLLLAGSSISMISYESLAISSILLFALLLLSVVTVPRAFYQKQENFKKLAAVNSISTLLANLMVLVLISRYSSVLLLPLQTFLINLFTAALCFKDIKLNLRKRQIDEFDLVYGRVILATSFMSLTVDFLYKSALNFYGHVASSGLFSQAVRLSEMPVVALIQVIQRVLFQRLVSRGKNIELFLKNVNLMSLIFTPILITVFTSSEVLVVRLLGPEWVYISPIMPIVFTAYYIAAISSVYNNFIKADGNGSLFLRVETLAKCSLLICFICFSIQMTLFDLDFEPHVLLSLWFLCGSILGFCILNVKFCKHEGINPLWPFVMIGKDLLIFSFISFAVNQLVLWDDIVVAVVALVAMFLSSIFMLYSSKGQG